MNKRGTRKYNSVTHGIFTRILLSGDAFRESRESLLELMSEFQKALQPQTAFENALIAKLAVLFMRLIRLYEADSKIAPKLFKRISELLGPGQPAIKARWVSPDDQIIVTQRDPSSESLMRYESNLERQIQRTLDQIQASQCMRRKGFKPAPPAATAEAPHA